MGSPALTIGRLQPAVRFDRWVQQRVRRRRGVTELPLKLEYRHIYVMPTRFGAWFGLLLITTAVGGLNFNNNMALLLGFTLAAIAQLTTLLAYRNLAGLTISRISAAPVFAGEPARFAVHLANAGDRYRFTLQGRLNGSQNACDLGPHQGASLVLAQDTQRRGWAVMGAFTLENRYPLGLFRAWSVIIPAARCLVYPRPASNPPPLPRSGRGDNGASITGEGDNYHGLREYRPGDAIRSIAWRTSARHGKLYTREMESPREESCDLNWYLMSESDPEKKLAILAAWVLRAERRQIPYSLELPAAALPAGLGEDHRDACLKILALHRQ